MYTFCFSVFTIFLWAYVPILSFIDQQEKFAASATCVTKLTLAARQPSFVKFFVLRCLKYFSVNWLRGCSKIKAFMNAKPSPGRRVRLWNTFLALPVKNGPLPAKLKCRENTAFTPEPSVSALCGDPCLSYRL